MADQKVVDLPVKDPPDPANAIYASVGGVDNQVSIGGIQSTLTAVVPVAGTLRELVLTDLGGVVEMNDAAANVYTIPLNATVAAPLRSLVTVVQTGAGATTVNAVAGVTLNGTDGGNVTLTAQWSAASMYQSATNAWVVMGDFA